MRLLRLLGSVGALGAAALSRPESVLGLLGRERRDSFAESAGLAGFRPCEPSRNPFAECAEFAGDAAAPWPRQGSVR